MTRRAIRLLVQGRENRLQFGLPGRYATFRARARDLRWRAIAQFVGLDRTRQPERPGLD